MTCGCPSSTATKRNHRGVDLNREEWLDDRLAAAGLQRTGEITCPYDRPWGTVHTAPTTGGPVWIKKPGPGSEFELPLYELLGRVAPEHVLAPIAIDLDRCWLLLPDGGTTLGDRHDVDLVDGLAAVLPLYGQLQRDLAAHTDELLSGGVADMRAAIMPTRLDEAVAAVEARNGRPLRPVREIRATFVQWCERLGGSRIPASLDHNDLHPWNVFLDDAGRIRFYDWGDSVVAHPFSSMLFMIAVVRERLGAGPDDAAVTRLRDAYLEVWSDLAPHRELVAEQELACWVGKVARALTWERTLREQGHDQAGEFADEPRKHLMGLLADNWSDLTYEP